MHVFVPDSGLLQVRPISKRVGPIPLAPHLPLSEEIMKPAFPLSTLASMHHLPFYPINKRYPHSSNITDKTYNPKVPTNPSWKNQPRSWSSLASDSTQRKKSSLISISRELFMAKSSLLMSLAPSTYIAMIPGNCQVPPYFFFLLLLPLLVFRFLNLQFLGHACVTITHLFFFFFLLDWYPSHFTQKMNTDEDFIFPTL